MPSPSTSPLDGPRVVGDGPTLVTSPPPGTIDLDGRRARGQRNRDAVVDAILTLLEEGVSQPGAAEIAERAGVSLRSVFRHFDDLDALFLAAIRRQAEHTAHLYRPPRRRGTSADRVAALVTQRRKLYEAVAPVRRAWTRRYDQHPTLKPVMEGIRAALRRQIEFHFEEDLDGLRAADRRAVIDAIDVATSFQTWDFLRFEAGHPEARAAAVVRRTITAVLRDAGVSV